MGDPQSVIIFCGTLGPHTLDQAGFKVRAEEAEGLIRAADLLPCQTLTAHIREPHAATLLSQGLIEQVAEALNTEKAGLFYVDLNLTPVQQRNLERRLHVKVIDRTGLILEIFGMRAQTQEGELQVLLARYTYQQSRLVRSWTHLERQRGGRGFLGGPGETQIEADRRAIDERIRQIKRKLDSVRDRRMSQRRRRRQASLPIIALVGYTNAGKTSLFKRLTQTQIQGEDKLFATLDPKIKRTTFGLCDSLLSDTVGFIRDLPTSLIAAFRATLEEVTEADIIIHVRDAANEDFEDQALAVHNVLESLGLDEAEREHKLIDVWNKVDKLDAATRINRIPETMPGSGLYPSIAVSALNGEGLDKLASAVEYMLEGPRSQIQLKLENNFGSRLAWLHRHTEVIKQSYQQNGTCTVDISATQPRIDNFFQKK